MLSYDITMGSGDGFGGMSFLGISGTPKIKDASAYNTTRLFEFYGNDSDS